MAWAAAVGGMVSSLTEGMASAAQYQAAKHERNISWKRQQQWELISPSLRMAGLRNAGINPMLAASPGMGGGPGHVATADPGDLPRFDPDIVSKAITSAKQAKAMATELKILENTERESRASALQVEEGAKQAQMQTRFLGEFGFDKAREELNVLQATVENIFAQRMNTNALTQRTDLDSLLIGASIPGARALEQFYKENPWARVVREFGGGSLMGSAIGLGAAGVAGAGAYLTRKRSELLRGLHDDEFGASVPGRPKRRKK